MERIKPIRLAELLKGRDSLLGRLSDCKYVLRGTIIKRGNICGKAGCRCKDTDGPIFHGPYNYLSHRSRKKTNMIFLNKKKLFYAKKGIQQYKELIQLLYQISEINFKILRYWHTKLKENDI